VNRCFNAPWMKGACQTRSKRSSAVGSGHAHSHFFHRKKT
jgi:hypothetical protein